MHPPHPDSLDEILTQSWAMLRRGVADRRHAFRTPALATVDAEGLPAVRTVVLRGIDEESRAVWCHTDARSPKATHIARVPTVAWYFYDAGARVQLRLRGIAQLIDPAADDRARVAWARTGPGSRVCYRAPETPGLPAAAPVANLPEDDEDADPEAGVDRFRLVRTTVTALDWLRLRHDGHRRARFEWGDAGRSASWVHP